MTNAFRALNNSAFRIGFAAGGALVGLLAIAAVLRPEMMGMAMIRHLIVGFGL